MKTRIFKKGKDIVTIDNPDGLYIIAFNYTDKKEALEDIKLTTDNPDFTLRDLKKVKVNKFKKNNDDYYYWGKKCGTCNTKCDTGYDSFIIEL